MMSWYDGPIFKNFQSRKPKLCIISKDNLIFTHIKNYPTLHTVPYAKQQNWNQKKTFTNVKNCKVLYIWKNVKNRTVNIIGM